MTAQHIAATLAQARCDLETLYRERERAQQVQDTHLIDLCEERIADLTDHMRTEVWRLSRHEWMPQPHKTAKAAFRLLRIDPY